MRRSSGSLEGPGHAKSVGAASAVRRAVAVGPVIGVSTSRKGRVVGGTTGGRPQGDAAPGPPGIARDATCVRRKAGGSARIDGREARTRHGLGTAATARRPGCLERRGGGARAAPSSPAGGTRGIGRTRGRFRVRSRSTGGGFEFKAARRPSTQAGAPAKAGATVTTGGAYRSDQPRLRRQGAFCPARTTACDRKIAPDASFYCRDFISGFRGRRGGPGSSLARAAGTSIGTSEPWLSRPDKTARMSKDGSLS